jgi:hypothetical protein
MKELPDDELDKLFRKSSEEFDPYYEPDDWNALSKRLDREEGKDPLGWLRKWWPLGVLALLVPVGLGYYWFKSFESGAIFGDKKPKIAIVNKPKVESITGTGQAVSKPEKRNGIIQLEGEQKLEGEQTHEIADPLERGVLTSGQHNGGKDRSGINSFRKLGGRFKAEAVAPESETLHEIVSTTLPGEKPRIEVQSNRLILKTDSDVGQGKAVSVSGMDDPSLNTFTTEKTAEYTLALVEPDEKTGFSVSSMNPRPFRQNEGLALPDIELQESVLPTEAESQRDISPKLAIRFGYSPDLTTVGLKNFSKPGSAVSLMVEYALLRRLYVQVGVVRSVKDYKANAGAYELKKYVTDINTPYGVDGVCTMIEVPVGFRYDLVQNERSRVFAGAGLASYYVQKEKYSYKYSDYVHGQMLSWKGKTGWFWLSHSSVSAGYEYRISNKLSLLAEPYIRIPLKGVGYGKVNLVTTGMWLSMRYTPVFNK